MPGRFNLIFTGTGTVHSANMTVSNSNATPAATWFAEPNGVDNGNNLGWIFGTGTVTAATIISDVLRRLAEDTAVPVFWSRAELLVFLNYAFIEFNLISGKLTSKRTQELVSANIFGRPNGAIAIMSITIANKPMENGSLEEQDREDPSWAKKTGIPKNYGPVGLNKLYMDRYVTASGTSAVITTLDIPQTLTEATVIDLDEEYILALEDDVFGRARFKEGGAEFRQGLEYYARFLNISGHAEERQIAEQVDLWWEAPNADTGKSYSPVGRS